MTVRQDKIAPSTDNKQDRGASVSIEKGEEDKKIDNIASRQDEDKDKTNDDGLPAMGPPLDDSTSRLETGIAPQDINRQEKRTPEDTELNDAKEDGNSSQTISNIVKRLFGTQ